MEYARKAVDERILPGDDGVSHAGNKIVWCHSLGYGIMGRCLAKLGRLDEAKKHFVLAAQKAKGNGYAFLEVIAYRDLKALLPAGSAEAKKVAAKMETISTPLGINCKKEFEALVKTLFLVWP